MHGAEMRESVASPGRLGDGLAEAMPALRWHACSRQKRNFPDEPQIAAQHVSGLLARRGLA